MRRCVKVEPITKDVFGPLLKLNNLYEVEIGLDSPESFRDLIEGSFWTGHIKAHAFAICLDQETKIEGENINWLKDQFKRFVYMDRIAVHPDAYGKGLGRRLYEDLFDAAIMANHTRLCCEINCDPPNRGSVAFHEKLGFTPFGPPRKLRTGKAVQYFSKTLHTH